MIEVIYKEEKQEAKNGENLFNLPRNIRQVGLTTGNMRIYIEDYVYTFLTRLARNAVGSGKEQGCVAVFTGETKWNNGITYLFIRGALMVEDMEAASDHIDFSEKIWAKIQEDQAKYFPGQEITGWFFSRPQMYMETDELLTRIHLRYFGGEKVLMLMEPQEREDAFFRYENNGMAHLGGYYLYYEKNPGMQTYMVDKNKELQPDVPEHYEDQAVKDFRKIITDKKEKKKELAAPSVFSYGLTACLAIAVLTVGMNFYRNYQSADRTGEESATVSSVIVEEITPSPAIQSETDMSTQNNTDTSENEKKDSGTPNNASDVSGDTAWNDPQEKSRTDIRKLSGAEKQTSTVQEETKVKSDKTEQVPVSKTEKSDKTEQIYQQESDERKAQKRVREAAQKENREAAGQIHESYVIQPGDTLYQICMNRYGNIEALSQLCQLNGMSADETIYPGQVIVLP